MYGVSSLHRGGKQTLTCIILYLICMSSLLTPYSLRRTLYVVHCTSYIVRRTLYVVHCTSYIVRRTLYVVHCTSYTVRRTLCDVHCTSYGKHLYIISQYNLLMLFNLDKIQRSHQLPA